MPSVIAEIGRTEKNEIGGCRGLARLNVMNYAKVLALILLAIVFSPTLQAPAFASAPTEAERVAALNAPATVFILSVWWNNLRVIIS